MKCAYYKCHCKFTRSSSSSCVGDSLCKIAICFNVFYLALFHRGHWPIVNTSCLSPCLWNVTADERTCIRLLWISHGMRTFVLAHISCFNKQSLWSIYFLSGCGNQTCLYTISPGSQGPPCPLFPTSQSHSWRSNENRGWEALLTVLKISSPTAFEKHNGGNEAPMKSKSWFDTL